MTTLIEDRDAEWEKAIRETYTYPDWGVEDFLRRTLARLPPKQEPKVSTVQVTIGGYGGWRILVNGKAEDWNWDKRVADLMADGLRYRLAKEAAKTPDEAKAVIEKVRGS